MHAPVEYRNEAQTAANDRRRREAGPALAAFDWSLEMLAAEAPNVERAAVLLAPGARVYVPWPNRHTPAQLLAAVSAIHRCGCEAVPHIAARRVIDGGEFEDLLGHMAAEHGLRRVLLIAGDVTAPLGPYKDTLALLETGMLVRAGLAEVGFGAYPEGHPHLERAAGKLVRDKIDAARAQGLAPHFVTQFSFAPRRILECCVELARLAPNVPVRIGIAGPTDPIKLLRYARLCGVNASRRALSQLGPGIARLAMLSDPTGQLAVITQHLAGRAHSNIAGAHIFSFGGLEPTARWLAREAGPPAATP